MAPDWGAIFFEQIFYLCEKTMRYPKKFFLGHELKDKVGNAAVPDAEIVAGISKKVDLNVQDIRGETMLHVAVDKDRAALVTPLVAGGALVDTPNNCLYTPFLQAVTRACFFNKPTDMMAALLENGAHIMRRGIDAESALTIAAEYNRPQIIRFLVEHGADIDASNVHGCTPLFQAARKGHMDIVRLLLDLGACPQPHPLTGKTAGDWAQGRHCRDIAKMVADEPSRRLRAVEDARLRAQAVRDATVQAAMALPKITQKIVKFKL